MNKYMVSTNRCTKGCCQVGQILYGTLDEDYDLSEIIESKESELEKYAAFHEMFEDGGDDNYALATYCVRIGHVDCLKTISKLPAIMYHYDLAVCAAEIDNVECLQFILEEMEDVKIPTLDDAGPNCKTYLQSRATKKNESNK